MSALDLPNLTARLGAEGTGREDLVGRVCGVLRTQIADGKIEAGTRLPSEVELAKVLRVSRPTLREATRILAQEGLLDIRHGIGTFVAARTPHLSNALDSMMSLSASIRAADGEPRVRSLVIEQVAAPRDVSQSFGLPAKADVIRIRRVRLMDEKPVGLALEYLPVVSPIDLEAMEGFDGSSLYSFIIRELGLDLLRSEMAVTAVSANAQQSRLLAVKAGAPLLLMRELHFGKADRRILYSVNYHNSAVVDLTLVRAGGPHMTASFTSLGNLSIDDLVFVDGTTQWAVPGGNAVYAALGMSVWGERPRVIAPFGPDYPVSKLEGRIDLSCCPRIPQTLRDWGLYEEDGSRQFIFRSSTRNWDDFSPRPSDVTGAVAAAHLAPLPWERHVSLVAALREAGAGMISIDLDDRKLGGIAHAAVAELIRSVDLFMPSRQDGRVIFPGSSPADTVRRFRDMAPDTKLVVLKCGADGCVAHAAGSRDLIRLPAFPVTAVDATGAGDTFCGGTLVGFVQTGDPVQALLHGAVSASFCVETVGCAGLLGSTPEIAAARLAQFQDAVHLQAA